MSQNQTPHYDLKFQGPRGKEKRRKTRPMLKHYPVQKREPSKDTETPPHVFIEEKSPNLRHMNKNNALCVPSHSQNIMAGP